MFIETTMDLTHTDESLSPEALLLNLDKEIAFTLPTEEQSTAILREVAVEEGRLAHLTLEIDDKYAVMFPTVF